MASVNFHGSYSISHFGSVDADVRLTFSESYAAGTNKTTLTLSALEFRLNGNTASYPEIPLYGKIKIGNATVCSIDNSSQQAKVQPSGGGYCAASIGGLTITPVVVEHNADGSKSVTVTLEDGYTHGDTYFSGVYDFVWAQAPGEMPKIEKVPLGVATPVSGTMTLTKRTRTWAVTYYGNGATSGSTAAQTKTYGVNLSLRANGYSRTGYVFHKWNTEADGSGTSYSAGATYSANAALTLYAQWKNTYTVSYNANGGSGAPAAQTKTQGVALTLSSTKPTKANTTLQGYTVTYKYHNNASDTTATAARTRKYTFSKWNTASNGSGTNYNPGATYSTDEDMPLYAQWTTSDTTSAVTLPTPTQAGYAFNGWYTEETGGTKVGNGGASYTPSADINLHAQWTPLASTIASKSATVNTQGTFTLTVSRKNSTYYHIAEFYDDSTLLDTSGQFATTLNFTVPRTWFSRWPNDTQGTVKVSVQTYTSGGTAVGSPAETTFTVNADSGMKPTVDSGWATAGYYNTGSAVQGSYAFVKGYSKAVVTFTASKVHKAAANDTLSYKIKCQGVEDSSPLYITPVLASTSVPIVCTVTDSRGRSASGTLTVSAIDYAAPKISGVSVYRCDSSNNADPDGQNIYIKATGSCTTINNWNSVSLMYKYKASNGSWSAEASLPSTGIRVGGNALDPEKSYTVQITATDTVTKTAVVTRTIPSRKWAMKFREKGNGVAFGKAAETDSVFDVNPDWTVKAGVIEISSPNYLLRKLPSPLSEGTSYHIVRTKDDSGDFRGGLQMYRSANTGDGLWLSHAKTVNGTSVANQLALNIDDTGKRSVWFSDQSAWNKALGTRYFAGDSIAFGTTTGDMYNRFAGDWRTTTNLVFTIPLAKPCDGLTAAVSGSVIICSNGSRVQLSLSNVTPTCYTTPCGVTVSLAYSSAPSYAVQYLPVTVQSYGLTITFS